MADIFDVLADGTRRDLLQVLLERYVSAESPNGEISVGDMVERLGLSQPTVSKHLKVLGTTDSSRCARTASTGTTDSMPVRSKRWRTG